MRRIMGFVLIAFIIVSAGWLYWIRVAPSKPTVWHTEPVVVIDQLKRNSVARLLETGPDGLARLHEVASQWPRTEVLAGSVEEGMVTYITRSKRLAFPDYTTVFQDDDELKIFARSRYGKNDFGVNDRRVLKWLQAMEL